MKLKDSCLETAGELQVPQMPGMQNLPTLTNRASQEMPMALHTVSVCDGSDTSRKNIKQSKNETKQCQGHRESNVSQHSR